VIGIWIRRLRAVRWIVGMIASVVFLHREDLPNLGRWLGSLRHFDRQLEGHQPWLSFGAIAYMSDRLGPTSSVFEYGSGGSTLWFADRVGRVTSVEHDPDWRARVQREIERAQRGNASVMLREPTPALESPESFEHYARACETFPDESFDLVLVDGKTRLACLERAALKVRVGGLLALDDSEMPRLRPAFARFATWPSRSFEGLRPGSIARSQTTFWTRPAGAELE
jgi:hypothetical protein